MLKEYTVLLARSKSQFAINKKFISLLSKRKIKGFDKIVHAIHDEIFSDIRCKECANCCRVLGPRLNETDINRIADTQRIKNSDFTARYLRLDEDGDLVFKNMPCPFIGTDYLCSIYDDRPRACQNYPHTNEKNIHGKLRHLLMNTLYCPAAALIAERLKEIYD